MKAFIKKPEVWTTLIYLISGFIWIILSDGLLEELALDNKMDIRKIQTIQVWKGTFYVVITGIILYYLLHQYFKRLDKAVFHARELFERSPNSMMVFDMETISIIHANEAASKKYGHSLKKFAGMPVKLIMAEEDYSLLKQFLDSAKGSLKGEGEWKLKLQSGTKITNHAFWSTIDYNGKNCRIFTFIDITEKKEKEHKLWLQEQKQQALINNTKDQIWALDTSFKLLSFNQAFLDGTRKMYGLTLKAGDSLFDQEEAVVRTQMWKGLFERAFDGDSFSTEIEETNPNGEKIFWEVSFNPIFTDNDDIEGACCFVHDITKRIERENVVINQLKQLREIAWIQSHKVRAPVANILGLAEMLKNADEKERAEQIDEMLNLILLSAEQLDQIIQEVVKLSHKIETDKQLLPK